MTFSRFDYENQSLATYLMQNEAKMKTEEFFAKLLQDEELDPKNCKVREIWVREDDWCGEYKVVFGRHFSVRAWQRLNVRDIVEAVMEQLANNEVAKEITRHPVYWENGQVTIGTDDVRSIAVIQEDQPFVVVYQAGDSYICPVTIWAKGPDMYFNKNTLVLTLSKTGVVSKA